MWETPDSYTLCYVGRCPSRPLPFTPGALLLDRSTPPSCQCFPNPATRAARAHLSGERRNKYPLSHPYTSVQTALLPCFPEGKGGAPRLTARLLLSAPSGLPHLPGCQPEVLSGPRGPRCIIASPAPEVPLPKSRCPADPRGCGQAWGMAGVAGPAPGVCCVGKPWPAWPAPGQNATC